MMSGLEINTTFVSYIKTSMYLTGMSGKNYMPKHIRTSLQYRPQ